MSISAVHGVSRATQQTDKPQTTTPAPTVTPFSQQLDAESSKAGAAHGHHHHGGKSQSVTSSAATAAAASGVTPSGSLVSALMHLLS